MSEKLSQYFEGENASEIIKFINAEFDFEILSKKLRILSSIAACQATCSYDVLKGFIFWGLDSGIAPGEIYEILLQGHLFCGYPKAIESFFAFKEVIDSNRINPDAFINHDKEWDLSLYKKRGYETARQIYGANFDLVLGSIKKLSPELARGMIYEGYGRIISRKGLDLPARELAIVAVLTVNYMPRQLYSHIRGAKNAGATRSQVKAVIEQCRMYLTPEIIANALSVLEKSLGN
jgi:4-carboxymuconolactone decarboxylase